MPRAKSPAFILVRPRNPGNIGSAARVLANFGFWDLRVVSPHPPIWKEALRLAADSKSLVRKAKVFKTLAEALEDRTRVYGTTCLDGRTSDLPVRTLPGFRPAPGSAILFGPENSGLFEEDLEYCERLVRVPTVPRKPSMNLAQAVAVICYEVRVKSPDQAPAPKEFLLPSQGIERLVEEADKAFVKLRYRPSMTPAARRTRVRRILRRRGVNRVEGGFLSEVLRRLEEI